ncbi:response regulator [Robertkochia flava]|uniref:response regulator n=1 Tax=Robertkochia flava TaxID=3447986 RepID=UPI001CC95CD1|nr:response regulator [Robertkochia marina]
MRKVLLIEDDDQLRENIAELLDLYNYEVYTTAEGARGVELAREVHPDVIVCDIMMPGMDGYQVLEKLSHNEETMRIPFIYMSAKSDRADVRKGMDLGADDYIPKPFEEQELISAIENRIARVELLRKKQQEQGDFAEVPSLQNLDNLKAWFAQYGEILEFRAKDHIYEEGNHSNYVYLIKEGMVKTITMDESGHELINKVFRPGDLFGYTALMETTPYRETSIAIQAAQLFAVNKEVMSGILLKNHHLTMDIIDLLSSDILSFKERLLQMAYGTVRKKAASSILQFLKQLEPKPQEGIYISRSDLASVAGIAPESFIRALTEFKNEGLISSKGRNIRVLDVEGLKNVL